MSKIYVAFAILLAIISAIGGTYRAGYTAGRDSNISEYETASKNEQAAILTALNQELKNAYTERDDFQTRLIELQKTKVKVEKVYVTRIIENNPGCPAITGFSELWNHIRAQYPAHDGRSEVD